MSRSRRSLVAVGVLSAVIIGVLLLGAPVATQEPMKGRPGGGETTTGNNLSYPVILIGGSPTLNEPPAGLDYALNGVFWLGWEDYVVGEDGTLALTQLACDPAVSGCPPEGFDLSRIYLQKNPLSVWQAAHFDGIPPVQAAYVDWSDNLESQTWTTSSVVRVETVPFASAPAALGFQMWWASGKGVDEVWGARTNHPAEGSTDAIVPTGYPLYPDYATVYTTTAFLTLQKLAPGNGVPTAELLGSLVWDPDQHAWGIPTYDNTTEPPTFTGIVVPYSINVQNYTAEINVGGKAIYGYNWMVKDTPIKANESRDGWWRLTFSTDLIGNVSPITFDGVVAMTPPPPAVAPAEILYTAKTDPNNPGITYIDIFLAAAKGGGKKVR